MNALAPRGLKGQVLASGDNVRIVGSPHPMMQTRVDLTLPAGLTVAELIDMALADYPSRLRETVKVNLNGDPIPSAMWHRVRPKPRTTITFVSVPAGGVRTMLLAAVAVFALVASGGLLGPAGLGLLGASFGAGGWGASALALGITVNGTFRRSLA